MENEFNATIFTPKKGIDWRLNSKRLMNGSFILLILTWGLFKFTDFGSEIIDGSFFLFFILMAIGIRWGYNEKKNGALGGILQINNEGVSIKGTHYPWAGISKFSFKLLQVLDEQLWLEHYPITRYYGGPAFSAGVDNYIDFKSADKQHRIYFQLETPSQKVELSHILRKQFFLGNINLQAMYNGLNLEYEQIQELKKEKIEWIEGKSS